MGISTTSNNRPAFRAVLMIAGGENPSAVAKKSWDAACKLISKVESNKSLEPELDLRASLEKLLKCFWFLKEERNH